MAKIGSDVTKFDYNAYKNSIDTYRIMYRNLKRIQRAVQEMVGIRCSFYVKKDVLSVTAWDPYRREKLEPVKAKLNSLGIKYQVVREKWGYKDEYVEKIKFTLPWELAQALADIG